MAPCPHTPEGTRHPASAVISQAGCQDALATVCNLGNRMLPRALTDSLRSESRREPLSQTVSPGSSPECPRKADPHTFAVCAAAAPLLADTPSSSCSTELHRAGFLTKPQAGIGRGKPRFHKDGERHIPYPASRLESGEMQQRQSHHPHGCHLHLGLSVSCLPHSNCSFTPCPPLISSPATIFPLCLGDLSPDSIQGQRYQLTLHGGQETSALRGETTDTEGVCEKYLVLSSPSCGPRQC